MKAKAIRRRVGSESPAIAGEDRDQAREDGDGAGAEEQGEHDGVGGERAPRARIGGGEVPVRLLHAERRQVRRQERHRGEEGHVTAALGAERPGDDQDAQEREDGGRELGAVRERRGAREARRPGRGDVRGRIPHYHRRVVVPTTGSIAAPFSRASPNELPSGQVSVHVGPRGAADGWRCSSGSERPASSRCSRRRPRRSAGRSGSPR